MFYCKNIEEWEILKIYKIQSIQQVDSSSKKNVLFLIQSYYFKKILALVISF